MSDTQKEKKNRANNNPSRRILYLITIYQWYILNQDQYIVLYCNLISINRINNKENWLFVVWRSKENKTKFLTVDNINESKYIRTCIEKINQ